MHAVVQQASDKQIIYIDDDKIQGLAAKEILEHLGHGATTFSDSAEAKDAILATPDAWDVVITELWMSGPSGIDIAKTIVGLRSSLRFAVVASGYLEAPSAGHSGVNSFRVFAKPATAQEFEALIRYICE
jgi:DNA-binding NtrC family response regulator